MVEQVDEETQPQPLQGAGPVLVSVAAAAAAGVLTVVLRKALSGGGGDGGSGAGKGREAGTAFDDIEQVADDLDGLVAQLRAQSEGERDFNRLVAIADTISEYADQAANAFAAEAGSDGEAKGSDRRVTDDLMSRIGELSRGPEENAAAGSPSTAAKEAA